MTELEERIAHLTRTVDDLSDVVARQSGEIDRLQRQVRVLTERAAEADEAQGGTVTLTDQRPPHW
jgi:SlyX protein